MLVVFGTNDTRYRPANEIMQGLVDLHHQIKENSPETSIVMSELIKRDDHPTAKSNVLEVNKLIRDYCNKNKIDFISHNNIHESSLNGSRLHLNRSGTALFAKNLITYLKRF